MNLTYKIALPAFLASVLVIVWVAVSAKRSLTEALSQEEFLRITEAVQRKVPQYLQSAHFLKPFDSVSQKQFRDFAEDLKSPSIARLTIWNRDKVIVFSDLKSIIGFHSPDHQDLKRLFAEENPFFIEKNEDANEPVQSALGEFADIYMPIRISGKVVGAVEIHSVSAAILSPVQEHVSSMAYILIPTTFLILGVVFVVVFRDTTHEKQAHDKIRASADELRASRDDLEKANKVKDEFLSVMSHELRTPLNVTMGYAGMLKDKMFGEINPEQEKALEKIIGRTKDQVIMINGILEVTGMEVGEVKVQSQEIGLGELLEELRSSYDVPPGKELAFNWDYPSDLPVVKTDGEKLKHILQNLINNAVKFTEKGTVTISARIAEEASGNRHQATGEASRLTAHASFAEFKVADTGIGIPEEALPFIFEKFRQVDSSETRLYGGIGLGLHIVKKLTDLLGGKVEVKSKVGKGSTFTVTIPVEKLPAAVSDRRPQSKSSRQPPV